MAGLGDSFILPKPGQETEHLWVLVTHPEPTTSQAIRVNITTQRPRSDTTTLLNKGDHPFIQKPSVVLYADARHVDPRLLYQAVGAGQARVHATFDPRVLVQIQAGMTKSSFTPKKMKLAYLQAVEAGLAA